MMMGQIVGLHPSRRRSAVVGLAAVLAVIWVSATVARPYVNLEERLAEAGVGVFAQRRQERVSVQESLELPGMSVAVLEAAQAFLNADFETAVRLCRQEIDEGRPTHMAWRILAAAYRNLGRPDEAAEAQAEADRLGGIVEVVDPPEPMGQQ
jgi:Flp pilus assembly protein TadD